jgi:hypothetical protein
MSSEAIMMVTQVCGAILGVSAVLGIATKVFVTPRIREVDLALARIEAHLAAINGSVGRMNDWQHQHEIDHARGER